MVIKKITINCDFGGGQSSPVTFAIGSPKADQNPIYNQSQWLSKTRGANVPDDVLDLLSKVEKIAQKNSLPLIDVYEYIVYKSSSKNNNTKK